MSHSKWTNGISSPREEQSRLFLPAAAFFGFELSPAPIRKLPDCYYLFFFFCAHLGDADPVHPLVQSPDVVAAQVLDVLRLLLDLRMLRSKVRDFDFIFSSRKTTGRAFRLFQDITFKHFSPVLITSYSI